MDLVVRKSGGPNIVVRAQARAQWYAPASVDAREVEISVQRLDDAGALTGAPASIGRFGTVAEVVIPHTPDLDCRLRVYVMPYGPDGTPGYSSLRDCPQFDADFKRETDAPTIGLNATATDDTAQIGITGFTRFARFRRVRIWADAGMATLLREDLRDSQSYADRELPRYYDLQRDAAAITVEPSGGALTLESGETLDAESGASSLPETIYVTVAHSGGNGWTAESNVLPITFASGDGTTPGTAGSFDPTPRDTGRFETL